MNECGTSRWDVERICTRWCVIVCARMSTLVHNIEVRRERERRGAGVPFKDTESIGWVSSNGRGNVRFRQRQSE